MAQRQCEDCGSTFEARRPEARFCRDACRKRASRRPPGKTASSTPDNPDGEASELVMQVRAELTDADRLATVAGQLALTLARRIVSGLEPGTGALSKELRAVMAEALAGVKKAADPVEAIRGQGAARRNGSTVLRIVS